MNITPTWSLKKIDSTQKLQDGGKIGSIDDQMIRLLSSLFLKYETKSSKVKESWRLVVMTGMGLQLQDLSMATSTCKMKRAMILEAMEENKRDFTI